MTDYNDDLNSAMKELTSPICDEETHNDFSERIKISGTDINQCCIDQPAILLEAVTSYESSLLEAERLKDLLSRAHSILDPQARGTILANGDKVTEAKVSAFIETHSEYMVVQDRYHAAKYNAGQWKAIVEACKNRKDMLIQVASNYRAEGHSEISLRRDSPNITKAKAILSQ